MPEFGASAPGKVILFGEHAVVHGASAIAAAISLRALLSLSTPDLRAGDGAEQVPAEQALPQPDSGLCLEFLDMDMSMRFALRDLPWSLVPTDMAHITAAPSDLDAELLAALDKYMGTIYFEETFHKVSALFALYLFLSLGRRLVLRQAGPGDWTIRIKSLIPIGRGLGSSACVVVCLVAALLQANGLPILDDTDRYLSLVNGWAFIGEKCNHGNPSGIDNTVASAGGAVFFRRPSATDAHGTRELIRNLPSLRILVVDTLHPKSTAALVRGVHQLYDEYPAVIGHVFRAIDAVSNTAKSLLLSRDDAILPRIGELITLNQKMLESLHVSHATLENVCSIVSKHRVGWTKLTGAGGGGCAIVLLDPSAQPPALQQAKQDLELAGYQTYEIDLAGRGVGIYRGSQSLSALLDLNVAQADVEHAVDTPSNWVYF